MPGRKSKGGQRRRAPVNRTLEFKDDGQEYAQVTKMLGNGRCRVQCFDGIPRLARIRGAMRNKVWIHPSDFVLVGLREFQDDKCDILVKYTMEEARTLKSMGEIPEEVALTLHEQEQEQEQCTFDFDDI